MLRILKWTRPFAQEPLAFGCLLGGEACCRKLHPRAHSAGLSFSHHCGGPLLRGASAQSCDLAHSCKLPRHQESPGRFPSPLRGLLQRTQRSPSLCWTPLSRGNVRAAALELWVCPQWELELSLSPRVQTRVYGAARPGPGQVVRCVTVTAPPAGHSFQPGLCAWTSGHLILSRSAQLTRPLRNAGHGVAASLASCLTEHWVPISQPRVSPGLARGLEARMLGDQPISTSPRGVGPQAQTPPLCFEFAGCPLSHWVPSGTPLRPTGALGTYAG